MVTGHTKKHEPSKILVIPIFGSLEMTPSVHLAVKQYANRGGSKMRNGQVGIRLADFEGLRHRYASGAQISRRQTRRQHTVLSVLAACQRMMRRGK